MKSEADLWQEALDSERGIKVRFQSPREAWHQRSRMYVARANLRKDSKKLFPEDNPMHGRSYFDDFIIKLEDADGTPIQRPEGTGLAFMVIIKTEAVTYDIERL